MVVVLLLLGHGKGGEATADLHLGCGCLGCRMQEVHVATDMSREEMKAALTATLQRVAK